MNFIEVAVHNLITVRSNITSRWATYGEVLWYVVLDETDVSGVSGASALLVHLVLVAVSDWDGLGSLHLGGVGLQE